MPAKSAEQKHQPLFEQPVPYIDGPSRNHSTWTAESHAGVVVSFRPNNPEGSVFVVQGTDAQGRELAYLMQGGRYVIVDIAQGNEVIEYGVNDVENQKIELAGKYGRIDSAGAFKRIGKPVDGVEDTMYASLRETLDQTQRDILRRQRQGKLGGGAFHSVSRAERVRQRDSEFFDPQHSLELYFSDPDTTKLTQVQLPGLDNFKPRQEYPDGVSSGYHTRILSEYRDKQNRVASKFPMTRANLEYAKNHDMNNESLTLVERFLTTDVRGAQVCEAMDITPDRMTNLSPKQTIELIGHVMYELTSYDKGATKGRPNRADHMNSLAMLREGMDKRSKQDVQPLGVCRNYSTTAKVLFDAFKSRNPQLANTHCFDMCGFGRDTHGSASRGPDGHAWVDFVQETSPTEIAAITVDPTWIRKSIDGRIMNYDLSEQRIGTHYNMLVSMKGKNGLPPANYSHLKDKNERNMTQYYGVRLHKYREGLRKKYGEQMKLKQVPFDEPLLSKAIHASLELAQFGYANGRYEPTPFERGVLVRASEDQAAYLSDEDRLLLLNRLVIETQNSQLSASARSRVRVALRNMYERMQTVDNKKIDDMTQVPGLKTNGLDERIRDALA